MGQVYLYTGMGEGKTTNALGMALRAVGHGKNVVIVQFLKWRKDTGEYLIQDKLKPYYEIYLFGRSVWLGEEEKTFTFGGQTFKVERAKEIDRENAERALSFARKMLLEKKPALLILDEVNLAVHWKLLESRAVVELLNEASAETTVVLTGRLAPQELIDRADFVNEIKDVKFPKEFEVVEGIQY